MFEILLFATFLTIIGKLQNLCGNLLGGSVSKSKNFINLLPCRQSTSCFQRGVFWEKLLFREDVCCIVIANPIMNTCPSSGNVQIVVKRLLESFS